MTYLVELFPDQSPDKVKANLRRDFLRTAQKTLHGRQDIGMEWVKTEIFTPIGLAEYQIGHTSMSPGSAVAQSTK
jgi:hypothetical protein